MKKLVFVVVVLCLAVPALATLNQSLGSWNEGAVGSTHQFWDFTPGYIVPSGGGYTAEPEVVSNPVPNRVTATINGTWDNISSITSNQRISVNLEIPNYLDLNEYKVIWVDIGSNVVDPAWVSIVATPTNIPFKYSVLPGQGVAEFGFKIWPNPEVEKIGFVIWAAPGALAVLDYIHVDTICIPEPATIALLGLGVLTLLRKRKA
ncbi:MAG: PEP-CTERM sorting domain-containing protein [Planctomycetota bacterium]|nr:PEP-CTERM sorting domain-containing protein [Planctomycetota bacterium]